MIKFYLRAALFIFISLMTTVAAAQWQILLDQSKLTFIATKNNAPIAGQFKKFTGDIQFAPEQLATSKIHILIDIKSLTTPYAYIEMTLKSRNWFDAKAFPQATLTTNRITKLTENTYQAQGELTIRDKTAPVVLQFTLEKYSPTEALVTGSTILKRSVFGVGRGEWAKTDEIKDDVQIKFTLKAIKK